MEGAPVLHTINIIITIHSTVGFPGEISQGILPTLDLILMYLLYQALVVSLEHDLRIM